MSGKKENKLINGLAWYLCRLLPTDRHKVLMTSYYGRGYSDNPKAIAEALLRSGKKVKIYWQVSSPEEAKGLPPEIKPVSVNGVRRIYDLSTARVWVDNCRKGAHFKRKNQYYLQTWHGFALKRIEKDVADQVEEGYVACAKNDSSQTDLIVSDSDFMTGIYQNSFWYDGPVEKFGAPRNDILARRDPEIYQAVRQHFRLPQDCKIVLYAPTFRSDHSLEPYSVDYPRLRRACEERFGGRFAVLIRLHPNIMELASDLSFDGETTFDASPYPDMQELLAASDVVVSDYSSLMFDFMLTRRPCFQFATDISAYRKDRNFYFPLDQLPFGLAENNDQLEQLIAGFDEDAYQKRLDEFREQVGMLSDGHGADRCADWILEKLN